MAHLLAPLTPTTSKPISAITKKSSSLGFEKDHACCRGSDQVAIENHVHRRTVALGLAGAVVGLSIGGTNAMAARRPPPPPPEEKKDPNVSGVTAKVLASKKRKEAMKESMSKLREKGKIIEEPSQ